VDPGRHAEVAQVADDRECEREREVRRPRRAAGLEGLVSPPAGTATRADGTQVLRLVELRQLDEAQSAAFVEQEARLESRTSA
jgi:hypothetical protein